MKCTIIISADNSAGRAHVEVDPLADAAGVAEDWQGLAARLGVTQAEAKRRAIRHMVATLDAADSIPPAKETVLLSAEDIEAQLEKERGAGKKAEKKAAKAEAKAEGK
jgi:hypothetical protein